LNRHLLSPEPIIPWYKQPGLWVVLVSVLPLPLMVLGGMYYYVLSQWQVVNDAKAVLSEKERLVDERRRFAENQLRERENSYRQRIEQVEKANLRLAKEHRAMQTSSTAAQSRLQSELQVNEKLTRQLAVEQNKNQTLTADNNSLTVRVQSFTKENAALQTAKAGLEKEKHDNDPAVKAKRLKDEEGAKPFRKVLEDYARCAKEYGSRYADVGRNPTRFSEDSSILSRTRRSLTEQLTEMARLEGVLRGKYQYTPQNIAALRMEQAVGEVYPSLDELSRRAGQKERRVSKATRTGLDHQRRLESYIRLASKYLELTDGSRTEQYAHSMRVLEQGFRDRFRYDAEDIRELRESWIIHADLARLFDQ
jgi:hypothetical protein